jgi:hypothetical protein
MRCAVQLSATKGQHVSLGVIAAGKRGEARGGASQALKDINDLDKIVLHEIRSSSTEVPVCHSREPPGMFRLPNPGANPRRLP